MADKAFYTSLDWRMALGQKHPNDYISIDRSEKFETRGRRR